MAETKINRFDGLRGLNERQHLAVQRLIDRLDLRVDRTVNVVKTKPVEFKDQVVRPAASRALDLANQQAERALSQVGVDFPKLKHQVVRYGRIGLYLVETMAKGTEAMMSPAAELADPRLWQNAAEVSAFLWGPRNRRYKAAGIRIELFEWGGETPSHQLDKIHLQTLAEALYIIRAEGPLDLASFEQASFSKYGFRIVGRQLLSMAAQIARHHRVNLAAVYVNRLRTVESEMNGAGPAGGNQRQLETPARANWAQLGKIQLDHDQRFRPDFFVDKDDPDRHLLHARDLAQLYHHGVESVGRADPVKYRDHLGAVVVCGLRIANFIDAWPLPREPVNLPRYS